MISIWASQVLSGKESVYQSRRSERCQFDLWNRKIPGGENGNALQYSGPDNPMDRGACALLSMVAELTRLSNYTCMHEYIWNSMDIISS